MASLDRGTIEAARNLGASRLRVLTGIIVPQVSGPLVVASVLTFVTLLSVLSVPLMINAASPSMITVDMAYRITSLNDYGTANALGVVSYLMTATVAWLYLRQGVRDSEGAKR
jgi:ABC-type spermidine/putrescine transport system permease subunit I